MRHFLRVCRATAIQRGTSRGLFGLKGPCSACQLTGVVRGKHCIHRSVVSGVAQGA